MYVKLRILIQFLCFFQDYFACLCVIKQISLLIKDKIKCLLALLYKNCVNFNDHNMVIPILLYIRTTDSRTVVPAPSILTLAEMI